MKPCLFAATLALAPGLATAGMVEDNMLSFVDAEVRAWFADPMLIAAVKQANATHAGLSAADIQSLDSQWRTEIGTGGELVTKVTENGASAYLRDRVQSAGGKVTELILMDARGLNVAVSATTSDFWQGDEEKHTETFMVGPGAVHVSAIELDESSQTYQAQVSFTLTDPATGLAIGAVTVGLNAESF